jgi:hypothetical protein
MESFKENINTYTLMWKQLELIFNDSFIQTLHLEIADRTPKELLQKVFDTMESKSCSHSICDQDQALVLKTFGTLKPFIPVNQVEYSVCPGMMYKIFSNCHGVALTDRSLHKDTHRSHWSVVT